MTRFLRALPFWSSVLLLPIAWLAATRGGWFLAGVPVFGFFVMSVLDAMAGQEQSRTAEPGDPLFWYKFITWIWLPIQLGVIFGVIWWIEGTSHLTTREAVFLMMGIGIVSGATGIVYAHELIHRTNRWERRLGVWLMISCLYGHFVTEHLAVHHRYVATPRDPATARYNESFYRFFLRVLPGSFLSAWRTERDRLRRNGKPVWALKNPFWVYWGGAALLLAVAWGIAGGWGVLLFSIQAFVAVLTLEQINYVEHYGLVRKHLGEGRYEPVATHHSWDSSHRMTNYLLINLQRHADHHMRPALRYPLLSGQDETGAPPLPAGYPLMSLIAYNPWLWRRMMNKRVRRWRSMFYPEIIDWQAYNSGELPMPR